MVEIQRGAPFWEALTFPVNIRLGRMCLIETNTASYYDMELITAAKGFVVQAPEVDLIKLFWRKYTHSCKLDLFKVTQKYC